MNHFTATHKLLDDSWQLDARNTRLMSMLDQGTFCGQGGFGTAIAIDEHHILKITTCEATVSIYGQLHGKPYAGLPQVFESLGQVGIVPTYNDPDKHIPLAGFVVEKLFCTHDLKELSKAPCPRGPSPMCARSVSDAHGSLLWLRGKIADYLRRSDMEPQTPWSYSRRQEISQAQAREFLADLEPRLRRTRFESLLRPLSRMRARLLTGEWSLDILERFDSNVLLSRWGEPILADPVWKDSQLRWKNPWGDGYQT